MRCSTISLATVLAVVGCSTEASDANPYSYPLGGDPGAGGDGPAPTCGETCDEGLVRCDGSRVVECRTVGACRTWALLDACTSGEVCRDGQCLPSSCTDGAIFACPELGVCQGGERECRTGEWSVCSWQIGPSLESCDGLDNNCDGAVDNGLVGALCPAQQGVCAGAKQRCDPDALQMVCDGQAYRAQASAGGATYETHESLCDGADNDCDGRTDDLGVGEASNCGATEACDDGSCDCAAGTHRCGTSCVSNTAVATCGQRCTPCPTDPHGTAVCSDGTCSITCSAGYHLCGGSCVPNDSTNSCGAACTPCTPPAHATATCDGSSCGFACVSGWVPCAGGCCEHCDTTGCTDFTYCSELTGLCEEGCAVHDQCTYGNICDPSTHACARTVDSSCPAGYTYLGMCSNYVSFCVHAAVSGVAEYPFVEPCPEGTTERGSWSCSDVTRVCVPD